MTLSTSTVVYIIITIAFAPIYYYGLYKWYQLRHHFLFKNRFPKEVCVIIIATYINTSMNLLQSILKNETSIKWADGLFAAIILSTSIFVVTFIFYRAKLVHLKAIQNRKMLSECTNVIQTSSDNYSNVKKQCSSKLLLSYTIISSSATFISRIISPLYIVRLYLFTTLVLISMIVGIIIIITIVKNKIKDRLGVLMDIWISMGAILFFFIFNIVGQNVSHTIHFLIGYLIMSFMGLVPLLFPLVLLKVYLGTLNFETIMAMQPKYISESQNEISLESTSNSETTVEIQEIVSGNTVLLYKFIKTELNYKLFAEYLSLCFATENLLFVVNVLAFFHHVLEYKKLNKDIEIEWKSIIYQLKFPFLTNVNEKYMLKNDDNDEVILQEINRLANMIYVEFIEQGADKEINISYENRFQLTHLLKGGNNKNVQVLSLDDYMYLFHDCLVATWKLMETCYAFGFQKYVRGLQTHHVEPDIGPELK
eukprot:311379_1